MNPLVKKPIETEEEQDAAELEENLKAMPDDAPIPQSAVEAPAPIRSPVSGIDELLKARSAAQDTAFDLSIGQRLNQALSQMGGVEYKPDYSLGETVKKKADVELENALKRPELELADPSSEASQTYREFVKEKLKLNVPDDVSAEALMKLLPALKSAGANSPMFFGGGNLVRKSDGAPVVRGRDGLFYVSGADGTMKQVPSTDIEPVYSPFIGTNPRTGDQFFAKRTGGGVSVLGKLNTSNPNESEEMPDIPPKIAEEAQQAVKELRGSESYKELDKNLRNIKSLRTLIDDAQKNGGQSLAMLGPKIAKGLAGEVGVLTEQDVTRYVQNPQIGARIYDTFLKNVSGKLSKLSADNLIRLTQVIEKATLQERERIFNDASNLFARQRNIDPKLARYVMDPKFSLKKKTAKQEGQFTEAQERGIQAVMQKNSISREKAIEALKKAGKLE